VTPRIPLATALDSKRLLGAAFEPFPAQRTILMGIEAATRSTLVLGRRSGKTRGVCAPYLVYRATCCPHLSEYVQRGEVVYHCAVAPKEAQARLLLDECRRLIEASPVFSVMVERSTDTSIRLSNGHEIVVLTASGRTGRGWGVASCVMDEAAWYFDTAGSSSAREVFRALSPSTVQFSSARRIIACSTPNGRGDWFHQRFTEALARADSDPSVYVAWLKSIEVNPTLDAATLANERADLGDELYSSEYEVQWLASGSALLSEADIYSCATAPPELAPDEIEDAVVAADFGWRRDPSVAVVIGRHKLTGMLTVARIDSWSPPPDLTEGTWAHQLQVFEEVAALAKVYSAEVWADSYESETVRSQLAQRGAYVHVISQSERKTDDHFELARRIRSGQISYPHHDDLINDLRRLKISYGGKRPTITNPRAAGRHGDIGAALAVSMSAFSDGAEGPIAISVSHPSFGTRSTMPGDGTQHAAAAASMYDGRYSSPGEPAWLSSGFGGGYGYNDW